MMLIYYAGRGQMMPIFIERLPFFDITITRYADAIYVISYLLPLLFDYFITLIRPAANMF